MYSATTIQMGTHKSNDIAVDNWVGDPATFKAGLCVHLDDDGDLSLAAADGAKMGISLGRPLNGRALTSVARKGKGIPVLLDTGLEPVIGAAVQISTTTGKAVASGTTVNAVYVSAKMSAIDEDGVAITDGAAYIDFVGGL